MRIISRLFAEFLQLETAGAQTAFASGSAAFGKFSAADGQQRERE